MLRWRHGATAIDSNSPNVHRREGQLANAHIKPVIFALPRCTSAVLFFSCCGSVAALRALVNELQRVLQPTKYFATAPAYTQRALHGAHSTGSLNGSTTFFPCRAFTRFGFAGVPYALNLELYLIDCLKSLSFSLRAVGVLHCSRGNAPFPLHLACFARGRVVLPLLPASTLRLAFLCA